MKKVELHFHTDESSPCGKVPAAEGIRLYREKGYSGVMISDHFCEYFSGGPEGQDWKEICESFLKGYRVAKEKAKEWDDFQVYLGMELRFPPDENDFLLVGFEEEFLDRYPWLYMMDQKTVFEIAEREGLCIIQAHPFRPGCVLAHPEYLHGVEIANGNQRHDSRDHLAKEAAEKYGLVATTGSDFHELEDLGRNYISFETLPENEQELALMLRKGQFFCPGK